VTTTLLAVFGPAEINFTALANLPAPAPQYIPVMNLGSGAMSWTVETNVPWIILDQPAGEGYGAIPLRVNPSLARGSSNTGQVIIRGQASGRTNAGVAASSIVEQVIITVTLDVLPPKQLEVYLPVVFH